MLFNNESITKGGKKNGPTLLGSAENSAPLLKKNIIVCISYRDITTY